MVSGIQGTWEGSLTNASVSEDDTRSPRVNNKGCHRILEMIRFPVLIGASVLALLAVGRSGGIFFAGKQGKVLCEQQGIDGGGVCGGVCGMTISGQETS